eukprot:748555-Hanusia_phi.AAC.1
MRGGAWGLDAKVLSCSVSCKYDANSCTSMRSNRGASGKGEVAEGHKRACRSCSSFLLLVLSASVCHIWCFSCCFTSSISVLSILARSTPFDGVPPGLTPSTDRMAKYCQHGVKILRCTG